MRILFVAMANSVHAARWVDQVADQGWDLHLFPAEDAPLHPSFRNLVVHDLFSHRVANPGVRVRGIPWWLPRGEAFVRGALAARFPEGRAMRLARLIERLQPDIVHSLEMQHAAYLVRAAHNHYKGAARPWIVTNWGSDIYLFGRLEEHRDRIRSVLQACHYYGSECERDVGLGRSMGFSGEVLPLFPCSGGYDLARVRTLRRPGRTSERELVVLKGYQGWAGRALFGLRALELCADVLAGRRVVVFSAGPDVVLAARLIAQRTGIAIEIQPECAHDDILRLHGHARVSIGLSISDAISQSLLEALVMGSFPVQSHTACADEWVEDGRSGLLVHPEDPEGIAAALRRALSEDALVDDGSRMNDAVVQERLERSAIAARVAEMYQRVASTALAARAGSRL